MVTSIGFSIGEAFLEPLFHLWQLWQFDGGKKIRWNSFGTDSRNIKGK